MTIRTGDIYDYRVDECDYQERVACPICGEMGLVIRYTDSESGHDESVTIHKERTHWLWGRLEVIEKCQTDGGKK